MPLKFLFRFILFCVYEGFACMYVGTVCMFGGYGGQKRIVLELELQKVKSRLVGSGS